MEENGIWIQTNLIIALDPMNAIFHEANQLHTYYMSSLFVPTPGWHQFNNRTKEDKEKRTEICNSDSGCERNEKHFVSKTRETRTIAFICMRITRPEWQCNEVPILNCINVLQCKGYCARLTIQNEMKVSWELFRKKNTC